MASADAQRIEICGGIASGKTTLACLLATSHAEPVLESFQSNPFWKAFYADPKGTAFETEVSFLLQHYHQAKAASKSGAKVVCDFSFLLDLAYAHVTLDKRKLSVFDGVYQAVLEELGPPALLVHLRCTADVELARVRKRGRAPENAITMEYLAAIDKAIGQLLEEQRLWNVVEIDSAAVNFAHDEAGMSSVIQSISTALRT